MSTPPTPDRRRTSRILHKTRIILSGRDVDGFNFAEETDTISVSKHGLAARTSYSLALGQEISVRTKEKSRVAQFHVVWLGKAHTPSEGRIGLEWVEPHRFWGIEFPPDDWESD